MPKKPPGHWLQERPVPGAHFSLRMKDLPRSLGLRGRSPRPAGVFTSALRTWSQKVNLSGPLDQSWNAKRSKARRCATELVAGDLRFRWCHHWHVAFSQQALGSLGSGVREAVGLWAPSTGLMIHETNLRPMWTKSVRTNLKPLETILGWYLWSHFRVSGMRNGFRPSTVPLCRSVARIAGTPRRIARHQREQDRLRRVGETLGLSRNTVFFFFLRAT